MCQRQRDDFRIENFVAKIINIIIVVVSVLVFLIPFWMLTLLDWSHFGL